MEPGCLIPGALSLLRQGRDSTQFAVQAHLLHAVNPWQVAEKLNRRALCNRARLQSRRCDLYFECWGFTGRGKTQSESAL